MVDLTTSDKICFKCKKLIQAGESYTAMVIDEDWEPTMTPYDMFTKPLRWKTTHNRCPSTPKTTPDRSIE